MFLAACGFEHHGPERSIGFFPRVTPQNFKAPFTAAAGWGTYSQQLNDGGLHAVIALQWGALRLHNLAFAKPSNPQPSVRVTMDGREIEARHALAEDRINLTLKQDVTLTAGARMEIVIASSVIKRGISEGFLLSTFSFLPFSLFVSDNPISPVFVAATIAVTLAPGPDILYVLAKGISQGRGRAILASAGFCSGLSVHTAFAALGFSALLMASAVAFTCVKIAGAGYLIYLGVRAWGSRGLISIPAAGDAPGGRRIFAQAFLMNVLNPKVAVFFLAFLPQFTHPRQGHMAREFFLLGLCFAVISFCIFSLVGIFSAGLGRWIHARPKVARVLDRTVGALFVGLGLRLALAGSR